MARKFNSKFTNVLPLLRANNVIAINWGFVAGKTNTMYAWGDPHPKGEEPKPWFHDIYRQDHTPYDTAEVNAIRRVNSELTVYPKAAFDTILTINAKDSAKKASSAKVETFVLSNFRGMTAQFTNYGARLVSLWVPAKDGIFRDVVWGFPNIKGYLDAKDIYAGPIVGRYGNRIGASRFSIDTASYTIPANEGPNQLHGGGLEGFSGKVWKGGYCLAENGYQGVRFTYVSPDRESGYPGELTIEVTYTLGYDNELNIDYKATTTSPTILNPTLHAYFNLSGTTQQAINTHALPPAPGGWRPSFLPFEKAKASSCPQINLVICCTTINYRMCHRAHSLGPPGELCVSRTYKNCRPIRNGIVGGRWKSALHKMP